MTGVRTLQWGVVVWGEVALNPKCEGMGGFIPKGQGGVRRAGSVGGNHKEETPGTREGSGRTGQAEELSPGRRGGGSLPDMEGDRISRGGDSF